MRKNGFSLLELLLATLLLAIGLVSLVNAFLIGFSQAGNAKGLIVAKNLAESRLEEIRNISYSNVLSESKTPVTGFSGFERQVRVSEVSPGLKQVEIDVFWNIKGSEVSISLVTFDSDI